MDLERGGRILGSHRHTPEKTVHCSSRDEHPPLFPLLWPVRSTPPRPDARMVRGTVRTSPHPQRHLDGPAVATVGQTPTHAQHHKALLKIVTKSNRPLFPRLLPLGQAARRDPRDDLRHQALAEHRQRMSQLQRDLSHHFEARNDDLFLNPRPPPPPPQGWTHFRRQPLA